MAELEPTKYPSALVERQTPPDGRRLMLVRVRVPELAMSSQTQLYPGAQPLHADTWVWLTVGFDEVTGEIGEASLKTEIQTGQFEGSTQQTLRIPSDVRAQVDPPLPQGEKNSQSGEGLRQGPYTLILRREIPE